MKNYYSILGVSYDCSESEIKAAFRMLARKFHPDINPNGAENFKNISEAYEVLSNPKKKLQYDTINGFFKASHKQEKQYTSSTKAKEAYKKTYSEENKNYEYKTDSVKESKENFSRKINDLFGEFSRPRKKKEKILPKNGEDVFEEISITIKEAMNGCERKINIMHSSVCPNCKGRKFINGSICPVCGATGEKTEYRKITVKVPKNVKNGAKLRLKGEGNWGENGGKNGDLFVLIKIMPNSRISFDENDNIIYNIPITPFEAALGGGISVPIFDGNVTLKIPPQTHNGQKFRLIGQGFSNKGKKTDLIITVSIEIPCSLSEDEIRLYQKLKKLSSQNIRENLLNE